MSDRRTFKDNYELQTGGLPLEQLLVIETLTNDRETIERACGDLDRSAAAFIPSLSQGEAIIVGPDLPAPLPIMMSKPEKGQRQANALVED